MNDKPEPLLSDHEVDMLDSVGAVRTIRDFYEAKIASGELARIREEQVVCYCGNDIRFFPPRPRNYLKCDKCGDNIEVSDILPRLV